MEKRHALKSWQKTAIKEWLSSGAAYPNLQCPALLHPILGKMIHFTTTSECVANIYARVATNLQESMCKMCIEWFPKIKNENGTRNSCPCYTYRIKYVREKAEKILKGA